MALGKKSKSSTYKSIDVNREDICNKKKIADALNHHFGSFITFYICQWFDADDTNLSTSDEILSNVQQKLNKDLKTLGNWLHVNKLSANLVKTVYMTIASAHKLKSVNYSPLIVLSKKKNIKRIQKADYIGLVIDEKLSWEENIKSLCKKSLPL